MEEEERGREAGGLAVSSDCRAEPWSPGDCFPSLLQTHSYNCPLTTSTLCDPAVEKGPAWWQELSPCCLPCQGHWPRRKAPVQSHLGQHRALPRDGPGSSPKTACLGPQDGLPEPWPLLHQRGLPTLPALHSMGSGRTCPAQVGLG